MTVQGLSVCMRASAINLTLVDAEFDSSLMTTVTYGKTPTSSLQSWLSYGQTSELTCLA